MPSFNKVIMIGNLTADPELKQTQSGISACRFTIAVQRRTSKDAEKMTDFFNVVAWRQTAEFVCRYFKKGRAILVCGSVQNNNWTDKEGTKRTTCEISADDVTFADTARQDTGEDKPEKPQQAPTQMSAPAYAAPAKFEPVALDDPNLPF